MGLLALSAGPLLASCLTTGHPCADYGKTDAIFVGKVTELRLRERARSAASRSEPGVERIVTNTPGDVEAVLQVREVFKGDVGPTVEAWTPEETWKGGFPFRLGAAYVVFAQRAADGLLWVSHCSWTASIGDASPTLAFLRGMKRGGTTAFITGQAWRTEVANPFGDIDSQPLARLAVTVKGSGRIHTLRTDDEGRFETGQLAPGSYEVSIAPGAGFRGRLLQEVEVGETRCGVASLSATSNGRVTGHLRHRDGGAVAEAVPMQLFPLDYVDPSPVAPRASLKALAWRGEFHFDDLPPGRYVLAVVPEDEVEGLDRYATSYYPGAPDRDAAHVITVERAQVVDVGDFLLEPPAPSRERSN